MPATASWMVTTWRVSIRARPRGRAMQAIRRRGHAPADEFQSAPGLEAGRCLAAGFAGGYAIKVSIRARPRGRAMPAINNLN